MVFGKLVSLVGGVIEMIYEIPEDLVENTRLCLHNLFEIV